MAANIWEEVINSASSLSVWQHLHGTNQQGATRLPPVLRTVWKGREQLWANLHLTQKRSTSKSVGWIGHMFQAWLRPSLIHPGSQEICSIYKTSFCLQPQTWRSLKWWENRGTNISKQRRGRKDNSKRQSSQGAGWLPGWLISFRYYLFAWFIEVSPSILMKGSKHKDWWGATGW